MHSSPPFRWLSLLALCALAPIAAEAWPIQKKNIQQNNRVFQDGFGTELLWHYKSMPKKASLPKHRMPYAGYIYPDNQGGCEAVLWKYDQAFHHGRGLAVGFERHDIEIHKEKKSGLFGFASRAQTPDWTGHCNGWTAAAIRHAEPQRSVRRGGVTFAPADIKGLLAELYVYGDHEILGGENKTPINPGMLHVILANWIARAKHPVGIDSTAGEEIWNYPVYAYSSDGAFRSRNLVEVKTNIAYVFMLHEEQNRAPRGHRQLMSLHYSLELNDDGEIIGGQYYRDSQRPELLWVPNKPAQGGTKGNEQGNPHMNAAEILAMWRESVPKEDRKQWWNIDPIAKDALVETNHPLTEE